MSAPSFRAGPVHVRAPATSANLGPGYDALGLALQWYDDVIGRIAHDGLDVDITGEGAALARDESHLVVRAMRATFDRLGGQPRGLRLSCANRIPHGRGLGSSAAAIVAGVQLARGLVIDGAAALSDPEAFALAVALEGHPDNVAACFYGGLTIAWTTDGRAHAVRAAVDPTLHPVVVVPPFESSTAAARGLLPATVPHADAAFGAGRSALLVALLGGAAVAEVGDAGDTARADALLAATDDRLHQPYRAAAARPSADLVARLRAEGLPAVVSGAGPTVLVLARHQLEVEQVSAATPPDWRCVPLSVDLTGAHVEAGIPAG